MPRPEFLVDRSLGRYQVANAIRECGLVVHTLWDVYGPQAELLADDVWINRAGAQGWFVLSCDTRLKYDVTTEKLRAAAVGVFRLPGGNMTGPEQAARYVDHIDEIVETCISEAPPFIYSVLATGPERVWP